MVDDRWQAQFNQNEKKKMKQKILDIANRLLSRAEKIIPKTLEPDLAPMELFPDVPDWHDFEHKIWSLGADLWVLVRANPKLRKDDELYRRILKIATNRNAKRGRQAFIMLFESKQLSRFAPDLMTQIDDKFVNGHIVKAVLKMHAPGYVNEIKPFAEHNNAWIRNVAKKYLEQQE